LRRVVPAGLALAPLLVVTPVGAQTPSDPPARAGRPGDGLVLDASLAVPTVGVGGVGLVGDFALGYHGTKAGVVASAGLDDSDRVEGSAAVVGRRFALSLDGWLSPGSSATRVEVRPSFGLVDHSSTRLDVAANQGLFHENSLFLRTQLLIGVRHEPDPDVAIGLWLGGGASLEGYGADSVVRQGGGGFHLGGGLSGTASGVGTLRFRAYVAPWPGAVSLRARVDAMIFAITHDAYFFDLSRQVTTTTDAHRSTQLDAFGRAFVDVDALSFGGFVPGAHVGLDLERASTDGLPTATTWVPMIGVGIRREAF
jgi:hypothetical protein